MAGHIARFVYFCALCLNSVMAWAQPLMRDQVPEPLRTWSSWALFGQNEFDCALMYNDAKSRYCAWPGRMQLNIDEKGGDFLQFWGVFAPTWVTLPGNRTNWPQSVKVDGQPAIVLSRSGRPAVFLAPGKYRVEGVFVWDDVPRSLQIPAEVGVVELSLSGAPVRFPDVDRSGQLWLSNRDSFSQEKLQENKLDIQVFRRIIDEVPTQVVTRIVLTVAGTHREIVLGKALLDGATPIALSSELPARLEPDGRIRAQVRPGNWTIELSSRLLRDALELPLHHVSKPWSDFEVWAFEARNHLRLIEVQGAQVIDPRQSNLPGDWQHLPAYLMRPGDRMALKVVRRGDTEPEPDRLNLTRDLWLDFDGSGYTVRDEITGTKTAGQRLEADPALAVGRAVVDGIPQLVTSLPGSLQPGIEVRRGKLDVEVESRIEGNVDQIAAVGWQHDFQHVSARLHLPPGWDLWGTWGADTAADAWVQRWTLLDLFLVLVLSIAIAKLWRWSVGFLALVTLVLIWQQADAPQLEWLHLIIATALLRVLPAGRMRTFVTWYRSVAALWLILVLIPFAVSEVRTGLYPQLAVAAHDFPSTVAEEKSVFTPAAVDLAQSFESESRQLAAAPASKQIQGESNLARDLITVDPTAKLQTGPGLPRWTWRSLPLSWNGPVAKEQQLGNILIGPNGTMLLSFVRVVLVASLLAFALGWRPRVRTVPNAAVPIAIISVSSLLFFSNDSWAQAPSQAMLDELKMRLTLPPACLPQCAEIPRLRIQISRDQLVLQMEVHAAQNDIAIPIPGEVRGWNPSHALVNGAEVKALRRSPEGLMLLKLERGVHKVELIGAVPPLNGFQIALPLLPHWAEVVAKGWNVDGVRDGVAQAQLSFTRALADREVDQLEPYAASDVLPAFVTVHRTLELGLDWQVVTRVRRVAPPAGPIVLEVPLLVGEAVTQDDVHTRNQRVLVNMTNDQAEFSWRSHLDKTAMITLVAPDTSSWTEVWRLAASTNWHVKTSGLAMIHHQDPEGSWLPEWHPWPGESVAIQVVKPSPIAGQTKTITETRLSVHPGQRATAAHLTYQMRSSHGGQHGIQLPPGATLQSVAVNGVAQPVRAENGHVVVPVLPGEQSVAIDWRMEGGIAWKMHTPRFDLGLASVNHFLNVEMPRDRWILLMWGPRLGPAVLIWGVLVVLTIIAIVLGRVGQVPVTTLQWWLLGVGLTQTTVIGSVVVIAWFLLLRKRSEVAASLGSRAFNWAQIALAALTAFAFMILLGAVHNGLLGQPDMQIAGNGSTAHSLNWYADRVATTPPQAIVFSVPLILYRMLMLAWALWLAFAVVTWAQWGWTCYAAAGLWRLPETLLPAEEKGRGRSKWWRRRGIPDRESPVAQTAPSER